jgi:GT2 family glycosyltransferase
VDGVYFDLPFWLSRLTWWLGMPVAIQNLPYPSPDAWLVFLDRHDMIIDRERLSSTFVDHGIYIPELPRGTRRLKLIGTSAVASDVAKPVFFPAIKPLIRWLDPFDFSAIARQRADGKDVGYAFRQKWKASRNRNEGYGYRRWRRKHVGRFAPEAAAGVGPVTFVLAARTETVPAESIEKLIKALMAQSDRNWRLIVPTAAEDARFVKPKDARIEAPPTPSSESLAGRLNAVLADERIDLVSLLAPDFIPTTDAVAMVRACFGREPRTLLAYTDEECVDDEGQPDRGCFKPAFSTHLLRALNYVGHVAIFRRAEIVARGGVRDEARGREVHELLLRYAAGIDEKAVRHIPRVACTSPCLPEEGQWRPDAELPPEPRADFAKVSIVIPTRDRADLLSVLLRSLFDKTAYRNFEVVIVDNGSIEPQTFRLLEDFGRRFPALKVVRDEGDFNFSRLINHGVAACSGDVICLLNNDIEIVDGAWLEEMLKLTRWPRVGIVGARLLYPDRTLQHAGVIVGLQSGVVHWFAGAAADEPGPMGRLKLCQNLTAVTGACMLVTRQCLEAAGPLDEQHLAVNFNDIDLCLKARKAGFEVVWTPHAELIHHESASRGTDASPEKRARSDREFELFDARWNIREFEDPYYSPNYDRFSTNCALAHPPRDLRPRTAG